MQFAQSVVVLFVYNHFIKSWFYIYFKNICIYVFEIVVLFEMNVELNFEGKKAPIFILRHKYKGACKKIDLRACGRAVTIS